MQTKSPGFVGAPVIPGQGFPAIAVELNMSVTFGERLNDAFCDLSGHKAGSPVLILPVNRASPAVQSVFDDGHPQGAPVTEGSFPCHRPPGSHGK